MTASPREADVLARYLVGQPAAPDTADRFARACATLFPPPHPPEESALIAYALRHPGLLPCLDAACALVRPGALLRRRILVMAAILEATPAGADWFLPRARSPMGLAWLLMRTTLAAAFHLAAGLPLLALAQRSRP